MERDDWSYSDGPADRSEGRGSYAGRSPKRQRRGSDSTKQSAGRSQLLGSGLFGLEEPRGRELSENGRFPRTSRSMSPPRSTDDRRVDGFFDEVVKYFFPMRDQQPKPKAIVVAHVVETLPPYMRALKKIADVACVIPKGDNSSERAQAKLREYEERCEIPFAEEISHMTREDKRNFFGDVNENSPQDIDQILRFIQRYAGITDEMLRKKTIDPAHQFFILDIGGYFARIAQRLKEYFGDYFLGIVEDTQNGHDRYVKATQGKPNFPFISIANSEPKEAEDFNVGKSIVEATDTLFRKRVHSMLGRNNVIGIIGFGKIGRSIAIHVREKNIRNIIVYDYNTVVQARASSMGFKVVGKSELLQTSDVIFCATGNKSLRGPDFLMLQDNVFISSCTSKNDEMLTDLLETHAVRRVVPDQSSESDDVEKYRLKVNGHSKIINLFHGGNAANFANGAVNGPYIYLVIASILTATMYLKSIRVEDQGIITFGETSFMRSSNVLKKLSEIWLKHFEQLKKEHLLLSYNTPEHIGYLDDPKIYLQHVLWLSNECHLNLEQDPKHVSRLKSFRKGMQMSRQIALRSSRASPPTLRVHDSHKNALFWDVLKDGAYDFVFDNSISPDALSLSQQEMEEIEGGFDDSEYDEHTCIIKLFLWWAEKMDVVDTLSLETQVNEILSRVGVRITAEKDERCILETLEQFVQQGLYHVAYFFLRNDLPLFVDDQLGMRARYIKAKIEVFAQLNKNKDARDLAEKLGDALHFPIYSDVKAVYQNYFPAVLETHKLQKERDKLRQEKRALEKQLQRQHRTPAMRK